MILTTDAVQRIERANHFLAPVASHGQAQEGRQLSSAMTQSSSTTQSAPMAPAGSSNASQVPQSHPQVQKLPEVSRDSKGERQVADDFAGGLIQTILISRPGISLQNASLQARQVLSRLREQQQSHPPPHVFPAPVGMSGQNVNGAEKRKYQSVS